MLWMATFTWAGHFLVPTIAVVRGRGVGGWGGGAINHGSFAWRFNASSDGCTVMVPGLVVAK